MRRILAALIFMLIGAGGMYAAFEFHVIQSKEGWLFIPKSEAGLHDTYSDIRKWQASTWKNHPKLAKSLIDNGKGNLIIQSASNGFFDGLFQTPEKKRSALKKETSIKRL
ncbi:MAG: hypothetical protein K0U86_21365 [Planctomycetes bacterium]|nr:hypothetical protein [Planctomycetota bacterium]MCH9727455.1 hypothetical protein [Planctomycetota bacterium]MCH9775960.1 hypothetical protein [Planctomycetota bacterium]MDF1743480.1 hypothetical protein [Gimesia sp.]